MGIYNVEIIGCPSFFQYRDTYPILNRKDSIEKGKMMYTINRHLGKITDLAQAVDAKVICQTPKDVMEGKPIFYNLEKWNRYIREQHFSFAFGSCFHGNMMALRNQILTLWIVHDWRTLELVRYLGLPYIEYYSREFEKIKYVQQLIERCNYEKVYKNYNKLYKQYLNFMAMNGFGII